MPTDPAIIADELTKRFEEEAGVFDLDLRVERGRIVALIGPSGSGKTTSVRLMTGLLAPDSGSISVLGQDPTRFTPETRSHIGYMAQDSVFFPDLTLRENLNFAASLFGVPLRRKRRVNEIVELLDLGEAFDRLLRDVSGGEKRRLSLAASLIHRPRAAVPRRADRGDRPNLADEVLGPFRAPLRAGIDPDGHHPVCGRGGILRSRRGARQGAGAGPGHTGCATSACIWGRLVRRGSNRPTGT